MVTPAFINLGAIVSSGTGTAVSITGLLLTLAIESTPPGSSGTVQGAITGAMSTNSSAAEIVFNPDNTTSSLGTLPGVDLGPSNDNFLFQIVNPALIILSPTSGSPLGQTMIQGFVTEQITSTTPEPGSVVLLGAGLAFGDALRLPSSPSSAIKERQTR